MQFEVADDQPRCTGPEAAGLHRAPGGVDQQRRIREAEIVVRREVDRAATIDADLCGLRPIHGAHVASQSCVVERAELSEDGFEGVQHRRAEVSELQTNVKRGSKTTHYI